MMDKLQASCNWGRSICQQHIQCGAFVKSSARLGGANVDLHVQHSKYFGIARDMRCQRAAFRRVNYTIVVPLGAIVGAVGRCSDVGQVGLLHQLQVPHRQHDSSV